MGRGRKGFIYQGHTKFLKKVRYDLGPYRYLRDPIDNTVDPVFLPAVFLPAGVIDRLKQMDPEAVAKLLLK